MCHLSTLLTMHHCQINELGSYNYQVIIISYNYQVKDTRNRMTVMVTWKDTVVALKTFGSLTRSIIGDMHLV